MKNTKCKNCECCSKNTVTRTDRKGNKVQYTYCDGGKAVHEKSNWLFIKGGYLRSTNYIYNPITDKCELQYFHYYFKDDKNNQIDHIDGDKTNNCLDNLFECSVVQNTQNRHDRTGCYFHNVKANENNTYTSFKIDNGKYTRIATCNTDIEAYDKFIKYCRNNQIGINPNTASWQTYTAVKDQIPYLDGVLHG